jgi:hypothetical protein
MGKYLFVCQIYVDDIIFDSTNKSFCDEFSKIMTDRFEMFMMGVLTFFLGFQIKQAKDGTFIIQTKYTHDILKKFGMDKAKPIKTPIGTNGHLDLDMSGTPVEKFYKDVADELLRPIVPKDPRTHRTASPSPVVAPSCTTHSGGASSSSSTNSGFLKMFWGIFAMCHRTDQGMNVMEQCHLIVWHNQEIIHSQWDEPLLEFPVVPIYPPVGDPYASLTPAKLVAFGIGPARAPNDDDDDDEATNDDKEMEDDE